MRIAVVDSDPLVLQASVNLIKKLRSKDEVCAFLDGLEFMEFLIEFPCEIIFLDPHHANMDGVMLTKEMKEIVPKANVIYLTSHEKYYRDAMELHISGYILKPLSEYDVHKELSDLRYPCGRIADAIVDVVCMGDFEVRSRAGDMIRFERSKAKELFAYLIHKHGVNVTLREMAATLFEDAPFDAKNQNYIQKIISSMMKTLREYKAEEVVIKEFNQMRLDVSKIECDYYHYLDLDAELPFTKEEDYLPKYSWARDY